MDDGLPETTEEEDAAMMKEWQGSMRAKAIFKVVVRDDDGTIVGSSPIIFGGSSFVVVDDVYRGEKKMYEAGKRYPSPGDTWFNVLRIKREEGEGA